MQPAQESRQKQLYEAIHTAYESHYFDEVSMRYREAFIYERLFRGVDLSGKRVTDLACSSGYNSVALLRRFPTAQMMGFDISEAGCEAYRQVTGFPARQVDLTRKLASPERFDAAVVIGGLHHMISDLETAVANVASMLKPGGLLLMGEPNRRSVLEWFRSLWYRLDKRYFDCKTEAALDYADLERLAAGRFSPLSLEYFGGPAYILLYNSLIVRFPQKLKPACSVALFGAERIWNKLPGRLPFPAFVAQWIRTQDETAYE